MTNHLSTRRITDGTASVDVTVLHAGDCTGPDVSATATDAAVCACCAPGAWPGAVLAPQIPNRQHQRKEPNHGPPPTPHTGCMCRVPLAETAVPTFGTHAELEDWCRREAVDLAPDHRGRLSIPLADAYRLYAEYAASAEAHSRAEAAKVTAEKAAVAEAQAKRQAVWNQARHKAGQKGKGAAAASQIAWEAVHEVEARLDPRIRDQLGSVRVQSTVVG